MKTAYAQMKISAGHPDVNIKKILQFIDKARIGGAEMIIFPEMTLSGKMTGTAWHQNSFINECENYNEAVLDASDNIIVAYGNMNEMGESMYILAKDGEFINESDLPENIGFTFSQEDRYRKANWCVKFSSEPFRLNKDIHYDKITFAKCPMIRVGCVGIQNTGKTIYTFDGLSAVFNSNGEVVQFAEPFTECLNFIDTDKIDKMPALKIPQVDEAERIYHAISYGVKNFLEQIGMEKIVIGVSGGIDSAVAAALYAKILGAENVYLVNMPSVFNSMTTRNLSSQLAENLGCKYFVVPIQESVDWTVKQLEGLGIEVSNFVRENIQARDRSARILAAIAASLGGGFTCNANKAETTVGYATLYGDEAGFLSALADLWKYQVYALANYMNKKIYRRKVIPQGIIDIVPSAELSTAQNVDEGKGDPLKYPYHDYLLKAFVEKNQTPEEILKLYVKDELENEIGCARGLIEKYFPTTQEFIADLERWWKLFTGMGIAKRIQSPPILAVTECPYGARSESQNGWHFTRAYLELKNKLLSQ